MDTKQAYKDKLEAQLEEWRAKIAQLKAQADKKEAVEHKMKELANASGEAWRELKSGVEKAVDDLKVSLEKASSKF